MLADWKEGTVPNAHVPSNLHGLMDPAGMEINISMPNAPTKDPVIEKLESAYAILVMKAKDAVAKAVLLFAVDMELVST